MKLLPSKAVLPRLYHHWIGGRHALPTDLDYVCIGCDLQFIYADWWVSHHLD
ncbi:MAG: hypothetical protein HY907_20000 [Deltaproteobacteria bacterium]|nr:hypothetical protein [Deltaproteobacteria bacterium]